MITGGPSQTAWRDDELDLIVGDYFAMLQHEARGHPYVKSRHNATLAQILGRSRGSIGRKHQNISAVFDHLGLPWIAGYKPLAHFQKSLIAAVQRHLTREEGLFEGNWLPDGSRGEPGDCFVSTPAQMSPPEAPPALRGLLGQFDPVARDHDNHRLGEAGERFVLEVETARLRQDKRPDLATRIRWVAREDGDGAGYDVLSFDSRGRERFIEVKTTNGSARTPFFITRHECEVAAQHPDQWRLYRVHRVRQDWKIFMLAPPLENAVHLRAETWRASFG